jgi:hypothetical protein
MKTQTIFNQRTLIIGIVMSLFISSLLISTNAKSRNNNKIFTKRLNDTCVLESFNGKRVEQINYLNCTIRSNSNDYYLVLEKSTEGKLFLPLKIKKGCVSPKNQILQFSFTDGSSSSANAVYKICAYKFSIIKNGKNQYLKISENLFDEFNNSLLSIKSLDDKEQHQITASR